MLNWKSLCMDASLKNMEESYWKCNDINKDERQESVCLTDGSKKTEGNGSNWGKENGKGDDLERER